MGIFEFFRDIVTGIVSVGAAIVTFVKKLFKKSRDEQSQTVNEQQPTPQDMQSRRYDNNVYPATPMPQAPVAPMPMPAPMLNPMPMPQQVAPAPMQVPMPAHLPMPYPYQFHEEMTWTENPATPEHLKLKNNMNGLHHGIPITIWKEMERQRIEQERLRAQEAQRAMYNPNLYRNPNYRPTPPGVYDKYQAYMNTATSPWACEAYGRRQPSINQPVNPMTSNMYSKYQPPMNQMNQNVKPMNPNASSTDVYAQYREFLRQGNNPWDMNMVSRNLNGVIAGINTINQNVYPKTMAPNVNPWGDSIGVPPTNAYAAVNKPMNMPNVRPGNDVVPAFRRPVSPNYVGNVW